jgi:hypothetical protein
MVSAMVQEGELEQMPELCGWEDMLTKTMYSYHLKYYNNFFWTP